MGSGARGKMLVGRVGSGGVEGRGPEVLGGPACDSGGRRSAVRRLGIRRPANIVGNIRQGSENIITNIQRVLGGSTGGPGGNIRGIKPDTVTNFDVWGWSTPAVVVLLVLLLGLH